MVASDSDKVDAISFEDNPCRIIDATWISLGVSFLAADENAVDCPYEERRILG